MNEAITAYKGFDKNLKGHWCFQYEIGKTYQHEGKVALNKGGFHSCIYPLDIFTNYGPVDSRFAVVKASGKIKRDGCFGYRIASSTITVEAEIGLPELIAHTVDWVWGQLEKSSEQTLVAGDYSVATNTGTQTVAANTGDYSVAANAGFNSVATNTGNCSIAVSTGDNSIATNTGRHSIAATTDDGTVATNKGKYSVATATGSESAATNTGFESVAVNTGNHAVATNTGEASVAMTAGCFSVAENTGYSALALNANDYSRAEVNSAESIAASLGVRGRARAGSGGAIVLCHRDGIETSMGHLIHIRASKVGENGIKPDSWYELDANGEFVEVG